MPKSRNDAKLNYKNNCGVCGQPLIYQTETVPITCTFCGKMYDANIYCPEGHYVCNTCHELEALEVLRKVLSSSNSKNPMEILETVLSHSSVPLHGPEHHAIVPAIVVAAVQNAGYSVPQEAIEQAIIRGSKVPGGWCGYYGACGAAVGIGIAVSIITQATPLTGGQRSLAIEATSLALKNMIDGQPRCCKRASRKALETAVDYLRKKLDIKLDDGHQTSCSYFERNKECAIEGCDYYH
jgi:hypothetical protein